MSAPRDLDDIPEERQRYAPDSAILGQRLRRQFLVRAPKVLAANAMINHFREMEREVMPSGTQHSPHSPDTRPECATRADPLDLIKSAIRSLAYGDFMELCAGMKAEPDIVWKWATK